MVAMRDMPVELYYNIFQFSNNQDLVSLARVSHVFQQEAENVLYLFVDLHTASIDRERALSWCNTVAKDSRKAHRVNTLKFPCAFEQPVTPDFGQHTIAEAFKAIVNLKHLFLLGAGNSHTASVHPATLRDCTFSLSSLAGQTPSFASEDMWDFVSRHPDIKYWVPSMDFLASVSSFPTHVLPNLQEAVIVDPAKIRCLGTRPVHSVVLVSLSTPHKKDTGIRAITALRGLSHTLHTLTYTHATLLNWSAVDMISCLGEHAPNLVSLTLQFFVTTDSVTSVDEQQHLLNAVKSLQRLETLVLNTRMQVLYLPSNEAPDPSNPREHSSSWEENSLSPTQCRRVASTFMIACPQLRRLSFPYRADSDSGGSLTYHRSGMEPTAAVFQGFHSIDTTGWWMR
ncbi:hypothetical protein FPV67DRAFT_379431 [Lyophyllum atratum]|nr:hypothetical protein FPV67DRAFT_379431 [Lyophyllum atratum]